MRSDIRTHSNASDAFRGAAELARLLADPTRLRILALLCKHREGMCVYEIAESVGSTPSATSHQLAKLETHGIVKCYREGQKMCYELVRSQSVTRMQKLLRLLNVV